MIQDGPVCEVGGVVVQIVVEIRKMTSDCVEILISTGMASITRRGPRPPTIPLREHQLLPVVGVALAQDRPVNQTRTSFSTTSMSPSCQPSAAILPK